MRSKTLTFMTLSKAVEVTKPIIIVVQFRKIIGSRKIFWFWRNKRNDIITETQESTKNNKLIEMFNDRITNLRIWSGNCHLLKVTSSSWNCWKKKVNLRQCRLSVRKIVEKSMKLKSLSVLQKIKEVNYQKESQKENTSLNTVKETS